MTVAVASIRLVAAVVLVGYCYCHTSSSVLSSSISLTLSLLSQLVIGYDVLGVAVVVEAHKASASSTTRAFHRFTQRTTSTAFVKPPGQPKHGKSHDNSADDSNDDNNNADSDHPATTLLLEEERDSRVSCDSHMGVMQDHVSIDNQKKKLLRKGLFGNIYELQLQPKLSSSLPTTTTTTTTTQGAATMVSSELQVEYQGPLVMELPSPIQQQQQQQQLLCLHRYKIWWMRPVFVPPSSSFSKIPPETMLLLYKTSTLSTTRTNQESNDSFQLVLPLLVPIHSHTRQEQQGSCTTAVASSSLSGWSSSSSSSDEEEPAANDPNVIIVSSHYPTALVYVGSHPTDPYALIQEAVQMSNSLLFGETTTSLPTTTGTTAAKTTMSTKAADESHGDPNHGPSSSSSSPLRSSSSLIASHLGWCTWNAFYTKVSGSKIVQAVHQLTHDCSIPIRWMIIDDGWQDVTSMSSNNNNNNNNNNCDDDDNDPPDGMQWFQRLKSMKEHPKRFADMSLKECISKLRNQYQINDVWCWHTLTGYWMGVLVPPPNTDLPMERLEHDDVTINGTPVTSTTTSSVARTNNGSLITAIPPSTSYLPKFTSGLLKNDFSLPREGTAIYHGIGIPDDPDQFWNAYHAYLRDCGVTGVKVDAQALVASIMSSTTNQNAAAEDLIPATAHSVQDVTTCDSVTNVAPSSLVVPVKSIVLKLQDAVRKSIRNNFGDPNHHWISCMAHAPEIIYFLNKPSVVSYQQQRNPDDSGSTLYAADINSNNANKPFLRAADDFYPDNPYSHGPHLVACAFNSLLLAEVSRVDWDMFTTCLEPDYLVQWHAISRCISGGPLYVSDTPDRIIKSVIDWIACEDGTTLPCRESARPTADCLLRDPLAVNSSPLVIFNTNGDPSVSAPNGITSGILGVFHVAGTGQWDYDKLNYTASSSSASDMPTTAATIVLSPSHIPYYAQDTFATTGFVAVSFFSKQATVLESPFDSMEVSMEPTQSEAISFIPLTKLKNGIDVASLGFIGTMINGAGAVIRQDLEVIDGSCRLVLHVRGCGRFWWAIRRRRHQQEQQRKSNDKGNTQILSSSSSSSASAESWRDRLVVQLDGVDQQYEVIEHDSANVGFPGGNELVQQGFVLVSFVVPPPNYGHDTQDRIVVFESTEVDATTVLAL